MPATSGKTPNKAPKKTTTRKGKALATQPIIKEEVDNKEIDTYIALDPKLRGNVTIKEDVAVIKTTTRKKVSLFRV